MTALDLEAIKQRAEAVDRFCRRGSDDFRPLSQRQLFDRDMPLLLQIAEQRQADGEHLIRLLAERDALCVALKEVQDMALAWANLSMVDADDPNRMASFVNDIHRVAVDALRDHRARART